MKEEDPALDNVQALKDLLNSPKLTKEERNFVLDALVVAVSFDGYISRFERTTLRELFSEAEFKLYEKRLWTLTDSLKYGLLQKAYKLSKLDFEAG